MKSKNIILTQDYEIIKGITKPKGSCFKVLEPRATELINSGVGKELTNSEIEKIRKKSKNDIITKKS